MHRPLIAIGLGIVGGLAGLHPAAIGALCLVLLVGIDLATRQPRAGRRPPTTTV